MMEENNELQIKEQEQKGQKEKGYLGEIPVIIKRDEHGWVKAVRGNVKLSEAKGHLIDIQGKSTVSATGYRELNKIAGLSIITPEKIELPDGTIVVNPYPIMDSTGGIEKVWSRQMAIGYTPSGSLAVTSATVLLDLKMYFVQDLMKKIKNNSKMGRVCVESTLTLDEKKSGIFVPIDPFMGIWANLENINTLKCVETYIQNKLFGERKAQTIAERNALKKHPALSFPVVDAIGPEGNKTANVVVTGYSRNINQKELLDLIEQATEGRLMEHNGMPIQFLNEVVTELGTEEMRAGADEEEEVIDTEFEEVEETKTEKKEEQSQEEGEKELREQLAQILIEYGITENDLKEDLSRFEKESIADLNTAQLKILIKRIG